MTQYRDKPDCAICGKPYLSHNRDSAGNGFCMFYPTYRPKEPVSTQYPTKEMIEAGKSAYHLTCRDEPLDVHLSGKLATAIYLAMKAKEPPPPSDMVERVAMAICEASQPFVLAGNENVPPWSEGQRQIWETIARAALTTIGVNHDPIPRQP